jgi:hypothetical protein
LVNLGVGGNGPLLELAAIREYVPRGRVSFVFWLYFEGNDLLDLQRDWSDALLLRYLDASFSQDLMARQVPINHAVREFVERRTAERFEGRSVIFAGLREAMWRVRNGQGVLPRAPRPGDGSAATSPSIVTKFVGIIARAKEDVAQRGGQLVFVNLPEYNRLADEPLSSGARQKTNVLEAVTALGVPVLDIEPALLRHQNPKELFPFGLKAHYSATGYRLVAEEIDRYIAASATSSKQ